VQKLLISTPEKQGVFQASKFLKWQFLIRDMQGLMETLPDFWILQAGRVVEDPFVKKQDFLVHWARYLEDPTFTSPLFSAVWTSDLTAVYAIDRKEDSKQLVRLRGPILQLRPHRFTLSKECDKIYSMAYGENTRSWGVELSYAALYSNTCDHLLHETLKEDLLNNKLYKTFVSWMRNHTRASKFKVGEKEIVSSIRIERGMEALCTLS